MYLYQHGHNDFPRNVNKRKSDRRKIVNRVKNIDAKLILSSDLDMVESLDKQISNIEKQIVKCVSMPVKRLPYKLS